MKFDAGDFMKSCREKVNLFKRDKSIGNKTLRPTYVLRLPVTLNSHKSALLE